MSGHSQTPANDQNTSSYAIQEQADTHRSLQQASQALELASNRIRQVRRSLLQLSESLPSNENILRIGAYNELRPAHDALVLTGADGIQRPTSVRADRRHLRDTTPLGRTASSLLMAGAVQTERSAGSAATAPTSRLDILRSMINADPSATTRGMRVAARQAMRQRRQDTSDGLIPAPREHAEVLFAPDATPDQMYAFIQARYARLQQLLSSGNLFLDFQMVDNTDGSRQSAFAAEGVAGRLAPSTSMNTNAITTHEVSSTPSAPPPLSFDPPSGQSTPRPLPAISLPGDTATTSTAGVLGGSREQNRLQMQDILLSDNTIFNSEQAAGSIDFWRVGQGSGSPSGRDSQDDLRHEHNHTQYLTTSDMEVSEEFAPSQPSDTVHEGDGSPVEEIPSPRRAWARLDADGDEIPSNEEEELERQRTSYRIRAQQRARQHLTPSQVDSTRSLGRRDSPRDMHGSVIDSTRTVPDVRRQQPLPPVITPGAAWNKDSYVNPLPMPLESMVMTTDCQKEDDIFIDIIFPNDTCIAGR